MTITVDSSFRVIIKIPGFFVDFILDAYKFAFAVSLITVNVKKPSPKNETTFIT